MGANYFDRGKHFFVFIFFWEIMVILNLFKRFQHMVCACSLLDAEGHRFGPWFGHFILGFGWTKGDIGQRASITWLPSPTPRTQWGRRRWTCLREKCWLKSIEVEGKKIIWRKILHYFGIIFLFRTVLFIDMFHTICAFYLFNVSFICKHFCVLLHNSNVFR